VHELNSAPLLAPILSRTIHQGGTVTVTNSAIDTDLPFNQLTYTLSNAPAGATIGGASGVFTWTPTTVQVNSTNEITVIATDNGSPTLSDSQLFTVTVLAPPNISSISVVETNVIITWSAIANTTYRVQYKADLNETMWHDLADDVVAAGGTASKIEPLGSDAQRFYRVLVSP